MNRAMNAGVAIGLALASTVSGAAHAEMVLSQVIVDLLPNEPRGDIEVFNDGPERMYVAADPFEIVDAGTPEERRIQVAADPEQAGLLVSPRKIVLAPGERQTIRVAAIGERPETDRVYRLAIRPVAGPLQADQSALKVLVGYDALVLVRPATQIDDVSSVRDGRSLTLTNAGNTAQELFDGRQCDASGGDCRSLPAKRLYPGGSWQQTLPFDTPATYKSAIGSDISERTF